MARTSRDRRQDAEDVDRSATKRPRSSAISAVVTLSRLSVADEMLAAVGEPADCVRVASPPQNERIFAIECFGAEAAAHAWVTRKTLRARSERPRANVDQSLEHVGRLRPPRPAIGLDGNRMGVNAPNARVERADVVGPGRHRRAEPGNIRREHRKIGAKIAQDIHAQGEKPPSASSAISAVVTLSRPCASPTKCSVRSACQPTRRPRRLAASRTSGYSR